MNASIKLTYFRQVKFWQCLTQCINKNLFSFSRVNTFTHSLSLTRDITKYACISITVFLMGFHRSNDSKFRGDNKTIYLTKNKGEYGKWPIAKRKNPNTSTLLSWTFAKQRKRDNTTQRIEILQINETEKDEFFLLAAYYCC